MVNWTWRIYNGKNAIFQKCLCKKLFKILASKAANVL